MDPTNKSFQRRQSLRLPEFDYSEPGAYFVTIVTQNRKTLFGKVIDGEMILNEIGTMVKEVIEEIPQEYHGINVEVFGVMPNHIHILLLTSEVVAGPCACHKNGQPQGVDPTKNRLSLPEIVHRFKSLTTHRYMVNVKEKGWSRFEKRLWQRNYHEHIIRNERDYQAIYDYILANPLNWEKDKEFYTS